MSIEYNPLTKKSQGSDSPEMMTHAEWDESVTLPNRSGTIVTPYRMNMGAVNPDHLHIAATDEILSVDLDFDLIFHIV